MNKNIVLIVFLLSIFLLISRHGAAYEKENFERASQIDSKVLLIESTRQVLGQYAHYVVDKSNRLTLNQITALPESRWTRSRVATPNFGYTDSAYWFRLKLKSLKSESDKILAIQYALLDHIEVFLLEAGSLTKVYRTGDVLPFSERPVRHRPDRPGGVFRCFRSCDRFRSAKDLR